jgi:hypothetical protein
MPGYLGYFSQKLRSFFFLDVSFVIVLFLFTFYTPFFIMIFLCFQSVGSVKKCGLPNSSVSFYLVCIFLKNDDFVFVIFYISFPFLG